MHSYLALLLSASPLLLAGCGTFVTDSVIEPYKSESYKLIGERAVVIGGYVASEMWPAKNVIYGERGPFSMAIVFSGMRDSGKVAAIRSLEVTADGETLFSRRFSSLRSVYFAYDAPGVRNYSRKIDGVRVIANGPLSFNFGGLFRVEHRPGRVVIVRAVVEVASGGSSETEELVFRHRAKTKRGVWKWYPPT